MQLVAGMTGQEYNRRKGRKGAFWQDRYHATAIETDDHLLHCMVYVDLNMVRAGVVDHPAKWKWSGYHQIQNPKKRYRIIDNDQLLQFLNIGSNEALAETHRRWIESRMKVKPRHQGYWSHSLAVGSKSFVQRLDLELGSMSLGRRITEAHDSGYQLKETTAEFSRIHSGIDRCVKAIGETYHVPEPNMIPWQWKTS